MSTADPAILAFSPMTSAELMSSDAPIVARGLAVVQDQKATILGLGGLVIRTIERAVWSWFVKALETYVLSWVVGIVVASISLWTVAELVGWLQARLARLSMPVRRVLGVQSLKFAAVPRWEATEDRHYNGDWNVHPSDDPSTLVIFHGKDAEADARCYAAVRNSGIAWSRPGA